MKLSATKTSMKFMQIRGFDQFDDWKFDLWNRQKLNLQLFLSLHGNIEVKCHKVDQVLKIYTVLSDVRYYENRKSTERYFKCTRTTPAIFMKFLKFQQASTT